MKNIEVTLTEETLLLHILEIFLCSKKNERIKQKLKNNNTFFLDCEIDTLIKLIEKIKFSK
jgi:hypothetical protein